MQKTETELTELRREIDEIDREICQLLAERNDVCVHIAENKRRLGLPLENTKRENEVIEKCSSAYPEYASETATVFRTIIEQSKCVQRRGLNLYFIGMPNCGKTKLASRVGSALQKTHVDTDALVMHQANMTIDAIFDNYGEAHFRALEHDVLVEVASIGGLIVATGGGILTTPENIPIIKNSGVVVFLDRSIKKLANARIANRPLLRDGKQAVYKLYNERIDSYRSAADICVDPDNSAAVEIITEFYKRKALFSNAYSDIEQQ